MTSRAPDWFRGPHATQEGVQVRVRMRQQITGLRAGQRWPAPGEELNVDDREGAKLCANGYAEPVAEPAAKKTEKRPARRSKKSESR